MEFPQYPFYYECGACKGEAFLINHIPVEGELMLVDDVYLPKQKRVPTVGDVAMCDSCATPIMPNGFLMWNTQNIKERVEHG